MFVMLNLIFYRSQARLIQRVKWPLFSKTGTFACLLIGFVLLTTSLESFAIEAKGAAATSGPHRTQEVNAPSCEQALGYWDYLKAESPVLRGVYGIPKAVKQVFQRPSNFHNRVDQRDSSGHLADIWALHDNSTPRQTEASDGGSEPAIQQTIYEDSIQNPHAVLKGDDPSVAMMLQRYMETNSLDVLPVYFRYRGQGDQLSTAGHYLRIWNRPPQELKAGSSAFKEWDESMNFLDQLATDYARYRDILGANVAEGYEALSKYELLNDKIREIGGASFFLSRQNRSRGLTVSVPNLVYDPEAAHIHESFNDQIYYDWATLKSQRDKAYEEYSSTFGIQLNPLALLLQMRPDMRKSMGQLVTGLQECFSSPWVIPWAWNLMGFAIRGVTNGVLNGLRGIKKYASGSKDWFVAKFFSKGQIQDILEKQAFHRIRLQAGLRVLELRESAGYTLNDREKELKEKIIRALVDPQNHPISYYVTRSQKVLAADEFRYMTSRKSMGNVNSGNFDKFGSHGENISQEDVESVSALTRLGNLFRRNLKTTIGMAILVTSGVTWSVGNFVGDRISFLISKNPEYSYYVAKAKEEFSLLQSEWLGGDARMYSEGANADRLWTLENTTAQAVANTRIQSFLQEYRRSGKNPLQDTELIQRIDDTLINEVLQARQNNLKPAGLVLVQKRLKEVAVPTVIVQGMVDAYKSIYPPSRAGWIEQTLQAFAKYKFQPDFIYQTSLPEVQGPGESEEQAQIINHQLLRDIRYFILKGYPSAYSFYLNENHGTLLDDQGTPYENFGKAPGEFKLIKRNFLVRSTPTSKVPNTLLKLDMDSEDLVMVIGEPNEEGYQEFVVFKDLNLRNAQVAYKEGAQGVHLGSILTSPTGHYFVHSSGLMDLPF